MNSIIAPAIQLGWHLALLYVPFVRGHNELCDAALKLDSRDNVLIALRDLRKCEQVSFAGTACVLRSDVPAKHKFAAEELVAGSPVKMYGIVVGTAAQPIHTGEIVTPRNLRHETCPHQNRSRQSHWTPPDVSRWSERTFLGYRRPDGQVGTRNYWPVVPLVFCENRNIAVLKQAFEKELWLQCTEGLSQVAQLARLYRESGKKGVERDYAPESSPLPTGPRLFENVDGIKFLLHEGGCGGTREDSNNLCALLGGYINHPNVAGATVLSLGCQHSEVEILRDEIHKHAAHFSKPLLVFEQQKSASEFEMLSRAVEAAFWGLVDANFESRVPCRLSHLCAGLKCGGSDGFSGISANPATGRVSDILTALGASTILSEFPELCGVEQELIDRRVNDQVAGRFIQLMKDYAARAKAVRSGFDMNPSPGNIRDGILTDAMKSAGAARKGGTSPITAGLDYPEYCADAGLNLQCTPGNDVECVTAQVGAGANAVLFTTGLGTPTGNPVAPVIKISTNSDLAQRMRDIIDVDAGPIV